MTDRSVLVDSTETPEDVATLYSWANLHGAKYRDFSASRAQTREKARQRVQDAIEAERGRARDEADARKTVEAQRALESAQVVEAGRKAELIAQETARRAELEAARQAAQPGVLQPRTERAPVVGPPAYVAPYAPPAVPPAYATSMNQGSYAQPAGPVPYVQTAAQSGYAPAREEQYVVSEDHYLQTRPSRSAADPRESSARPAWLVADRSEVPKQPVPPVPEDTLLASRDRLTSRWFALKGVFAGADAPAEAVPAPAPARAPVLAVFSLAGGVGKTSLVATLGRALSARGERVLLVDTAAFGLLPFFFGARDQRPGVLRTFTAPGATGDAPIQMVTVDPETLGPETAPQESLTQEISRLGRGASRVIVDLATASGATTRRILRMSPTVLVPVIPDMSSVVSVSAIDSFFQHNVSASGQPVRPFYVLNQFDPSIPLHLDVREVLREQLGDRLLPFALRRTSAVSEALAEGMTVVDYAPNSNACEDFASLAGWVKSLAAPASSGYRGVRWSER